MKKWIYSLLNKLHGILTYLHELRAHTPCHQWPITKLDPD